MDRETLGKIALVLGLIVALNPLYLGLWFDVGHVHADPVSPSAVEEAGNRTTFAFEDLPRHARLVVGRAIEKGAYTVLGPSNRPDQFVYPSGLDSGSGEYYVERDGNYYRLHTSGDVFSGVYLVVQAGLVALGALVASAGRSAQRGDRHPALPLVGGVLAVALTASGPPLGYPVLPVRRWSLAVVGISVVVVLAVLARRVYLALAGS